MDEGARTFKPGAMCSGAIEREERVRRETIDA
jgi:hypothetical protein